MLFKKKLQAIKEEGLTNEVKIDLPDLSSNEMTTRTFTVTPPPKASKYQQRLARVKVYLKVLEDTPGEVYQYGAKKSYYDDVASIIKSQIKKEVSESHTSYSGNISIDGTKTKLDYALNEFATSEINYNYQLRVAAKFLDNLIDSKENSVKNLHSKLNVVSSPQEKKIILETITENNQNIAVLKSIKDNLPVIIENSDRAISQLQGILKTTDTVEKLRIYNSSMDDDITMKIMSDSGVYIADYESHKLPAFEGLRISDETFGKALSNAANTVMSEFRQENLLDETALQKIYSQTANGSTISQVLGPVIQRPMRYQLTGKEITSQAKEAGVNPETVAHLTEKTDYLALAVQLSTFESDNLYHHNTLGMDKKNPVPGLSN